LLLTACGTAQRQSASEPTEDAGADQSEANFQFGSKPTTDRSFELIKSDRSVRYARLRDIIVQAGASCSGVTKAYFAGGLDGTDEWVATCTDTGYWQIWMRAGSTDIRRCGNSRCE
jgi:hypothetical protein